MEIDKTTKKKVYKDAKKQRNPRPRKRRNDSDDETQRMTEKQEYDSDDVGITNTLKALYCLVNNKSTCTNADVFFDPDIMTNCVIYATSLF